MRRFDNPDVTITDVMASYGKWRASKTAVVCGPEAITWREFNNRINQVANRLMALGLSKGDKVSLLSGNCIEVLIVLFGIIKAGGVAVPLSVMVQGDSLARMVIDSDSRFLFVHSSMAPVMDPFRDDFNRIAPDGYVVIGDGASGWTPLEDFLEGASRQEPGVRLAYEDPINIMYTSGTTGVPKGIVHTHHNRLHFAMSFATEFRCDSSAVNIVATALYANGTWLTMLPTMLNGGTLVIMPKFDPQEFLGLVQKHRCTNTFMVPTQFTILLEQENFEEYDLSSMRVWLSAGSPFRPAVKRQVLERFPGDLMELWGLTEGVGTILRPEEMAEKTESVGIPRLGWEVGIIDEQGNELPHGEIGEIVAYSSWLMPQYYKLPEKTEEAIWLDRHGRTYLRTGDMGKLDRDGFLYILDRKKDMIISGGINIFASDIEEVACRLPEVADVVVIGVPHPKWGETPVALVVPKTGAAADLEAIKQRLNNNLAKYQRVSQVILREDFPRNVLGKVLKRELRDEYRDLNSEVAPRDRTVV
ncbi:MAG: AMP-binding protein [Proteobacteria bacterium]|nr:AMP-binding protein [Pseudomonadota bacterium]MBU1449631.1 AMP-binding protein [Pseudomonadota bacterium]MBU2469954.1 AMP-binding protein [Pseudomonadota bacterium]MBU2517983.1 AMP-binding protein [Pseudomonadota bacterium]